MLVVVNKKWSVYILRVKVFLYLYHIAQSERPILIILILIEPAYSSIGPVEGSKARADVKT